LAFLSLYIVLRMWTLSISSAWSSRREIKRSNSRRSFNAQTLVSVVERAVDHMEVLRGDGTQATLESRDY
jgi:hypothetical protein